MVSLSELKGKSRQQLLGNYRACALAFILMQLSIDIIVSISTTNLTRPSIATYVFQCAFTFLFLLLYSVFLVGQNSFYLKMACGFPFKVRDIFYGFRFYPNKSIQIQFVQITLMLLGFLPFLASAAFFFFGAGSVLYILLPFTFCLGILSYFYISLRYAFVFYLVLDFPHLTAKEILSLSAKIMKGNKARLLGLRLSFIPFSLLSIPTLGIGNLWITPYKQMTYTQFYLDCVSNV